MSFYAQHRGGGGRGSDLGFGGQADEAGGAPDGRVLSRFFVFLRRYRGLLIATLAAVAASAACAVEIPDMIRRAVVAAVKVRDPAHLDHVLIGFVLLVFASIGSAFLEQRTTSRLGQRVIFDVRRAMFLHLQNLSLSVMDRTHVGRIMARIQGDVNVLQEFLEGAISALGDMVVLAGIAVVLLLLDWKLALMTLTVAPLLVLARAIWLPKARATFRQARDASSVANSVLAENINGVRTIQESRREAFNFQVYDQKAGANFRAQVRASAMAQVMVPAVDILTGLAASIVIVVGGQAVLGGALDVGVMVAFIFYVQRFFEPVRTLSIQYTNLQQAIAAGGRVLELLDIPVTIADRPGALSPETDPPSVEFRHVSFGYVPGQTVLHDVNFSVKPGEVIALVGPTGSGKTSIISLIRRFYETDQGQVFVGGRDVCDLTLDSLGRRIGMVLQEPFLFSGTIAENIRYNSAADRDAVISAATAVSAHEFIMRLPDGYRTQLGQRGRNLSGGQRQLIALARVLVADPDILILDEATANIDSFTEQVIQKALGVLFAGRTTIIIAHRLATVREADRIIVLQNGRIQEQGSHDELLEREGLYAHLHASSHASFDDAADLIARVPAEAP